MGTNTLCLALMQASKCKRPPTIGGIKNFAPEMPALGVETCDGLRCFDVNIGRRDFPPTVGDV